MKLFRHLKRLAFKITMYCVNIQIMLKNAVKT